MENNEIFRIIASQLTRREKRFVLAWCEGREVGSLASQRAEDLVTRAFNTLTTRNKEWIGLLAQLSKLYGSFRPVRKPSAAVVKKAIEDDNAGQQNALRAWEDQA